MYKIGTGEQGTLAGKVYQFQATSREGEVNWVYCKGKLYSRRANEPLSQVVVTDPITLKTEGKLKLIAKDLFSEPQASALNRYCPILTDGNNLYLVTMRIATKQRKVRESMKVEHQAFVRRKTLLEDENAKKKSAQRREREKQIL